MHVARIFQDRMVLQRNQEIRVWGVAEPGANIVAALGRLSSSTRSDPDGRWELRLDAQEAARGLTLKVSDGEHSIEFHDVAIGEVWIAGGQSNMEFQLEFDADREGVFAGAMNRDIRFFDVPKVSYQGQEDEHDYRLFGRWRSCTAEDLRYFSAVGYYFAEHLQEALQVPVGIVGCNYGGTPACAWTNRGKLKQGAGAVWVEEYEHGLTQFDPDQEAALFRAHRMSDRSEPFRDPLLYRIMRDGLSEGEERQLLDAFAERALPTLGRLHPNRPGGLFETMVRQIAPYACRGVIWYQGESDAMHPDLHGAVMGTVIDSWRELWGRPDLPFLITQLAPFGGTPFIRADAYPEIREQQAKVAESVERVWMASTSDVGAEHDIHPKKKKPVGNRLGLLARRYVYGQPITADAPALQSAKRTITGVEITFRNAAELRCDGGQIPLDIRSPRGDSIPASGFAVCGNRLLVTAAARPGAEIRFAWTAYYNVDLRNEAGIPAVPFAVTVL